MTKYFYASNTNCNQLAKTHSKEKTQAGTHGPV